MRNEKEFTMDNERAIFVKLMPSEWVDSFLKGNIYCNTAKYFADLNSTDIARSDPDEDVDESFQIKELSIFDKTKGEYVPIGGLVNPAKFRCKDKQVYNMFCVYMLLENEKFMVSKDIDKFGDCAIAIHNIKEFTYRLRVAAEKRGLAVYQGPIEYVSEKNYHGPMGAFRKYDSFAYQSEFRYQIFPGNDEAIELNLGDISDLCIVLKTDELFTLKSKLGGDCA